LQDGWKLADRTELLSHRVSNADLLDIKSPIDGIVDIPRSMSDVDLDVTPALLLRAHAVLGGDVRPGLTIEQAGKRVNTYTIRPV
jgi:hypothetical protein